MVTTMNGWSCGKTTNRDFGVIWGIKSPDGFSCKHHPPLSQPMVVDPSYYFKRQHLLNHPFALVRALIGINSTNGCDYCCMIRFELAASML